MDPVTAGAKLLFLVILGPVAALYDLATNPAAPPQIFAAQFTEGFGHPPGSNIPQPEPVKPVKPVHKHVYVSHS